MQPHACNTPDHILDMTKCWHIGNNSLGIKHIESMKSLCRMDKMKGNSHYKVAWQGPNNLNRKWETLKCMRRNLTGNHKYHWVKRTYLRDMWQRRSHCSCNTVTCIGSSYSTQIHCKSHMPRCKLHIPHPWCNFSGQGNLIYTPRFITRIHSGTTSIQPAYYWRIFCIMQDNYRIFFGLEYSLYLPIWVMKCRM